MNPSPINCHGVSYLAFTLNYRGNAYDRKTVYVHKLVAYQKFGDNALVGEVRHMDNNSLNNAPHNIEMGTHSDNMNDMDPGIRHRICRKAGSVSASRTRRLTDNQVEELIRLHIQGYTNRELAKRFGVAGSTISRIITGDKYA